MKICYEGYLHQNQYETMNPLPRFDPVVSQHLCPLESIARHETIERILSEFIMKDQFIKISKTCVPTKYSHMNFDMI